MLEIILKILWSRKKIPILPPQTKPKSTNQRKGEIKNRGKPPTKRQNPWIRVLRVHKGFAHTFSAQKETLSRSGLILEHTSFLGIKIPAHALVSTCQNIQSSLPCTAPFQKHQPILLLILAGNSQAWGSSYLQLNLHFCWACNAPQQPENTTCRSPPRLCVCPSASERHSPLRDASQSIPPWEPHFAAHGSMWRQEFCLLQPPSLMEAEKQRNWKSGREAQVLQQDRKEKPSTKISSAGWLCCNWCPPPPLSSLDTIPSSQHCQFELSHVNSSQPAPAYPRNLGVPAL